MYITSYVAFEIYPIGNRVSRYFGRVAMLDFGHIPEGINSPLVQRAALSNYLQRPYLRTHARQHAPYRCRLE